MKNRTQIILGVVYGLCLVCLGFYSPTHLTIYLVFASLMSAVIVVDRSKEDLAKYHTWWIILTPLFWIAIVFIVLITLLFGKRKCF